MCKRRAFAWWESWLVTGVGAGQTYLTKMGPNVGVSAGGHSLVQSLVDGLGFRLEGIVMCMWGVWWLWGAR